MTTPTLPAQLTYGRLKWTTIGLDIDAADADDLPDVVPINGIARVRALLERPQLPAGSLPSPLTILLREIALVIDNGRLKDLAGHTEVKLLANDSPGLDETGWAYEINYELDDGFTFGSFQFTLSTNEVKDLTLEVPLTTTPEGVIITKGPSGTVQIGQVMTGLPGSNASVVNVGTLEDAVLNITIPQGAKGDTGNVSNIDSAVAPLVTAASNTRTALDARYAPVATGTTVSAATAAATINTLMLRDSAGRAKVVDGAVASDIATKGQLDTAIATRVATSALAAASGVATLDSGGKLLTTQLPDLAITSFLGSVATQAAMLALVGQRGDWCVRTDLGTVFVVTAEPSSTLANWTQLTYPTAPVTSVATRTGAVTLTAADITNSTTVGRALMIATDAPTARTAIGAGTSSLALGTSSTTAATGDHNHSGNMVTPEQFGAVGNGTTDDTTAIQNAINSLGTAGGVVRFRGAQYKITTLNVPSYVELRGAGPSGTTLATSVATGNVITLNVASAVRFMRITSTITRTAGAHVRMAGSAGTIEACRIESYFLGVEIGTESTVQVVQPRIIQCSFSQPAITLGSGAIHARYWSNLVIDGCVITGTTISTQQPTFGLRLWYGDTVVCSNTNITTHGRALWVDIPSGLGCYAAQFTNCLFDSAGFIAGNTNVSCVEITPTGNMMNTIFSNCWFGLASTQHGVSVIPVSTGQVDGLAFTGCQFVDNGGQGLNISGAGVKNWTVVGCQIGGNANGIAVSGSSDFMITANRVGNIAGRGGNGYGVNIIGGSASDRYTIQNNNCYGNVTASIFDGGTGTNKNISGNIG